MRQQDVNKVASVPLHAKTVNDLLPVIARLLEQQAKLANAISSLKPASTSVTQVTEITEVTQVIESVLPEQITIVMSETQPEEPFDNLRWYNPAAPAIFIYYGDGTSGQWVQEPGGWPIA